MYFYISEDRFTRTFRLEGQFDALILEKFSEYGAETGIELADLNLVDICLCISQECLCLKELIEYLERGDSQFYRIFAQVSI